MAACRQRFVKCASSAGLHRIAYREWGEARNERVLLCAHGLTRCARDCRRYSTRDPEPELGELNFWQWGLMRRVCNTRSRGN